MGEAGPQAQLNQSVIFHQLGNGVEARGASVGESVPSAPLVLDTSRPGRRLAVRVGPAFPIRAEFILDTAAVGGRGGSLVLDTAAVSGRGRSLVLDTTAVSGRGRSLVL